MDAVYWFEDYLMMLYFIYLFIDVTSSSHNHGYPNVKTIGEYGI
jgi:hypothetical protein